MKKLLPLLLLAGVLQVVLAQTAEHSPFLKSGYTKPIVYTASYGLFEEFHDLSDTVEIGDILFDCKNNKIVGFLKEEEVRVDLIPLSIDPHAPRYWWVTPYAYCLNNPLRYIDPDGKDPGDLFKTKIDAANDFALYYNGTSIKMNREFGSFLYKNKDGTYSYTIANIGTEGRVRFNNNIPENTTAEERIHTHGAEDPKYKSYEFSPGDKAGAEKRGQNDYLVTPAGQLLEYDVNTKTSSVPEGASKDIPSDSKSGNRRVNKVDPVDTKPIYIDPETKKTYNE